jgi:hypothetical protein
MKQKKRAPEDEFVMLLAQLVAREHVQLHRHGVEVGLDTRGGKCEGSAHPPVQRGSVTERVPETGSRPPE